MSSLQTVNQTTTGIVLVGTHPWASTAFDQLMPRTLLPVAHRPLISYALSWLRDGGIRHAAVCANRETQILETRLVRHVPDGLTVSYQEDQMPRGAAGAVRDAALASDAETFVIADGTSIPSVDLPGLLAVHRASGAAVTVVVHAEPGRNGRPGLEAPTGVYVFSRQALDSVPATGFYDIKENLIPQLHRAGKQVAAYSTPAASPRVLDCSSYLAVNEWMVEHLVMNPSHPEGYVRSGSGLIHSEAIVADDAVFVGPVLVGPGAHIHSGAVLVGPTSIGREATVGRGVLVSRSAVWRRCILHNQAVADRCILADDTVIAANTEAFRAVMWTNVLGEPEIMTALAPRLKETSSLELLRRMGRVLLGASWSRSTAAQ